MGAIANSSARAIAAGITATPGCKDDSVVTSSSSTACAAVPLASAAQTAEVARPVPTTLAVPCPPNLSPTSAAGGLEELTKTHARAQVPGEVSMAASRTYVKTEVVGTSDKSVSDADLSPGGQARGPDSAASACSKMRVARTTSLLTVSR